MKNCTLILSLVLSGSSLLMGCKASIDNLDPVTRERVVQVFDRAMDKSVAIPKLTFSYANLTHPPVKDLPCAGKLSYVGVELIQGQPYPAFQAECERGGIQEWVVSGVEHLNGKVSSISFAGSRKKDPAIWSFSLKLRSDSAQGLLMSYNVKGFPVEIKGYFAQGAAEFRTSLIYALEKAAQELPSN